MGRLGTKTRLRWTVVLLGTLLVAGGWLLFSAKADRGALGTAGVQVPSRHEPWPIPAAASRLLPDRPPRATGLVVVPDSVADSTRTVAEICNAPPVETLELCGLGLTDDDLAAVLRRHRGVRTLLIADHRLTAASLRLIAALPRLERAVVGCGAIPTDALLRAARAASAAGRPWLWTPTLAMRAVELHAEGGTFTRNSYRAGASAKAERQDVRKTSTGSEYVRRTASCRLELPYSNIYIYGGNGPQGPQPPDDLNWTGTAEVRLSFGTWVPRARKAAKSEKFAIDPAVVELLEHSGDLLSLSLRGVDFVFSAEMPRVKYLHVEGLNRPLRDAIAAGRIEHLDLDGVREDRELFGLEGPALKSLTVRTEEYNDPRPLTGEFISRLGPLPEIQRFEVFDHVRQFGVSRGNTYPGVIDFDFGRWRKLDTLQLDNFTATQAAIDSLGRCPDLGYTVLPTAVEPN